MLLSTNYQRSLGGRHRCGKRLCSKDTTSRCSRGQSPILILLLTSRHQDRPHKRVRSGCRWIVSCLLWFGIVHSLRKAAFPMLPRIPCPSMPQSRTGQIKHHNPSVILSRGLYHNPLQIRAWQKTRLRTFQFGSLSSDELLSTSQSHSL